MEHKIPDHVLSSAIREAVKNGIHMVVMHAPIENAEEDTPFGYCPRSAAPILFRHGTLAAAIYPNGKVTRFND